MPTKSRRSSGSTVEYQFPDPDTGNTTFAPPQAPPDVDARILSLLSDDGAREPFPLALQRRARKALPWHAWRLAYRVSTLLVADMGMLLVLRTLYRGLTHDAWLGTSIASAVRTLVPNGTFPVVQLTCAILLGLAVFATYGAGDYRRRPVRLFGGVALGLSLVYWPQLWGHAPWPTWFGFGVTLSVMGSMIVVERLIVDVIVRRVRPSSAAAARTLVIGPSDAATAVGRCEALRDPAEYNIVGFLDLDLVTSQGERSGSSDIAAFLESERIDTIVLAGATTERAFDHIFNIADGAGCHVLAIPLEFLWRGTLQPRLVRRNGTPIIQLTRPGLRGSQLAAKRCFDLFVSSLVILLLLPFMLLIALAVKVTSRGPALFKQERVGRGGHRFHIYKFRTMLRNADKHRDALAAQSMYGDMRLFKMEKDPRVTRVGAVLRRTSLDELPQLWNVLKGDMSLVGPRPPMPSEVELYDDHHYTRFDMKPGITGPWQVNGRNKITDFEEVVKLEHSYAREWSIWKDFQIIARTIPVVLKMEGAH